MPTIESYAALAAVLVTNTTRGISGNKAGNLMASTLGVRPYVSKTADYTATESDETIVVSSIATYTVTLPACASTRVGKIYTVQVASAGTDAGAIVAAAGSDLINGQAAVRLFRQYAFVTIQNTGSAWIIINQYRALSGPIYTQISADTVASTASETSLITASGSTDGTINLPANFYQVNTIVKVKARGYVSNTGTPTLNMKVKHGSTVLAETGTVTTSSGLSNNGWTLETTIVCRTIGGSGTLMALGEFRINSVTYGMVNTSTVTLDTTAAQTFGFTATWGTSSGSNTITCQELIVEFIR